MKKIFLTALSLVVSMMAFADEPYKYNELYYQRASLFDKLPVEEDDIVFVGNSLTQICEWHELFGNPKIKNRGIIGDVVQGIRDRIDCVVNGHPRKIFLLCGTNDVSHNLTADSIATALGNLIDYIRVSSPQSKLYVQSLLPVNDTFGRYKAMTGKNPVILDINRRLAAMAKDKGFTWIDAHSIFADGEGNLDRRYTNDGLHVMGDGYLRWRDLLLPYINE